MRPREVLTPTEILARSGGRLALVRQSRKLRQSDVAEAANVTQATVARWEQRGYRGPLDGLYAVAAGYRASPSRLVRVMFGDHEPTADEILRLVGPAVEAPPDLDALRARLGPRLLEWAKRHLPEMPSPLTVARWERGEVFPTVLSLVKSVPGVPGLAECF